MELMQEISRNSAEYAVAKYALHLPAHAQRKLYKRTYDATLAALMAYEEVSNARRIRGRAQSLDN